MIEGCLASPMFFLHRSCKNTKLCHKCSQTKSTICQQYVKQITFPNSQPGQPTSNTVFPCKPTCKRALPAPPPVFPHANQAPWAGVRACPRTCGPLVPGPCETGRVGPMGGLPGAEGAETEHFEGFSMLFLDPVVPDF